ncbi:MAG: SHOCT domain-containing protein [Candidatus Devosia euplotis]|nr:SHOCT domain-containing protein [Candidatus Devosia euplotis]
MHKTIIRAIGAFAAAMTLTGGAAMAQAPTAPETYAYGPRMMWWGGGWEGVFFGPLFMLLFVVAAVLIVLFVARLPGGLWQGTAQSPSKTPIDILKDRFARGEIDKADYEERCGVLGE